jgi:hypothetical protein
LHVLVGLTAGDGDDVMAPGGNNTATQGTGCDSVAAGTATLIAVETCNDSTSERVSLILGNGEDRASISGSNNTAVGDDTDHVGIPGGGHTTTANSGDLEVSFIRISDVALSPGGTMEISDHSNGAGFPGTTTTINTTNVVFRPALGLRPSVTFTSISDVLVSPRSHHNCGTILPLRQGGQIHFVDLLPSHHRQKITIP